VLDPRAARKGAHPSKPITLWNLLGVLYVLKKTLNYPQLNCQPGVSKLRVVEKYMPKVKILVGV
jgi:hypothetical protein